MKIHQLDVTTAYLNGELEEKIYMEIPKFSEQILDELIVSENNEEIKIKAKKMLQVLRSGDKVCLLRKALYDLRQAGRQWHIKLSEELNRYGLKQSTADPCVYFAGTGENILIVAVYVNDIIVVSRKL